MGTSRKKHQRAQLKNPRGARTDQHGHSRACVARFVDERGVVDAFRSKARSASKANSDNSAFCGRRGWGEHLEAGRRTDRWVSSDIVEDIHRTLFGGLYRLVFGPHCDIATFLLSTTETQHEK